MEKNAAEHFEKKKKKKIPRRQCRAKEQYTGRW